MEEPQHDSRTSAAVRRIADAAPFAYLRNRDTPETSLQGWVIRERPGDAIAFLKLFGLAALAVFILSSLLVAGLWVADAKGGLWIVGISVVASGGVAVGSFALAAWTDRNNAGWYPGKLTFKTWPIPVGQPVRVIYELRRRDVLADHPTLVAQLLYKELEHRQNQPSRYRTKQCLNPEVVEERRTEPVVIEFDIVIPSDWSSAADSSDFRVLLQIFRHEGDGGVAYPVELAITVA